MISNINIIKYKNIKLLILIMLPFIYNIQQTKAHPPNYYLEDQLPLSTDNRIKHIFIMKMKSIWLCYIMDSNLK
jgi:hypothetical protein